MTKSRLYQILKSAIKKALPNKKLFLVIGKIRFYTINEDWIDSNITSEFAEGGNWLRWDFIPENEIWILENLSDFKKRKTALHELIEVLWMQQGYSYEQAHTYSAMFEDYQWDNQQNSEYIG
jgi:hypothetical protein